MKPWQITRREIIALKFCCPDCGQKMDAGRELLGELTECPACGRLIQVPDVKNVPGHFNIKRPTTRFRRNPV